MLKLVKPRGIITEVAYVHNSASLQTDIKFSELRIRCRG